MLNQKSCKGNEESALLRKTGLSVQLDFQLKCLEITTNAKTHLNVGFL